MSKLFIALEQEVLNQYDDGNPATFSQIAEAEAETAEIQLGVDREETEVAQIEGLLGAANEELDNLEQIQQIVEKSEDEGLSDGAQEIVEVAVEQICQRLGLKSVNLKTATEAYASNRKHRTQVTLESLGEVADKVKKGLVAMWNWLVEKVGEFINWVLKLVGAKGKLLERMIAKLKEMKSKGAKVGDDAKVSVPEWFEAHQREFAGGGYAVRILQAFTGMKSAESYGRACSDYMKEMTPLLMKIGDILITQNKSQITEDFVKSVKAVEDSHLKFPQALEQTNSVFNLEVVLRREAVLGFEDIIVFGIPKVSVKPSEAKSVDIKALDIDAMIKMLTGVKKELEDSGTAFKKHHDQMKAEKSALKKVDEGFMKNAAFTYIYRKMYIFNVQALASIFSSYEKALVQISDVAIKAVKDSMKQYTIEGKPVMQADQGNQGRLLTA